MDKAEALRAAAQLNHEGADRDRFHWSVRESGSGEWEVVRFEVPGGTRREFGTAEGSQPRTGPTPASCPRRRTIPTGAASNQGGAVGRRTRRGDRHGAHARQHGRPNVRGHQRCVRADGRAPSTRRPLVPAAHGRRPCRAGPRAGWRAPATCTEDLRQRRSPGLPRSDEPRSRNLYARHGFNDIGVIQAGTSPPMWAMLREPSA
jgi:hypothetical protein